jgi:ABC-type iron transport system FetAB ATPase subunit
LATLTITNLSFQQRGPFSLRIESDQIVSLTGPSGAGKSLLLRAIADLDLHQGDCAVDDKTCNAMPAPQWRRLVGLLPAKSVWWFDTVGEHFQEREQPWLGNLGFETDVMNWTVSRLSTGEQQRLSLLRLLQNRPQVLLLDEPTASLDADNTRRVEQLINEYQRAQHCAILWVTHDRQQATRIAQRHLVIDDNQLHETGNESP